MRAQWTANNEFVVDGERVATLTNEGGKWIHWWDGGRLREFISLQAAKVAVEKRYAHIPLQEDSVIDCDFTEIPPSANGVVSGDTTYNFGKKYYPSEYTGGFDDSKDI